LNVHIEELNDFRNLLLEDKRKYFIVLAPKGKSGPSVIYLIYLILHT